MRLLIICFLLSVCSPLLSQSKKELQAEVTSLKSQIEELKKPKEVELTDIHKKASYGLGVLVASNLKTQGGDSLNVEALTSAINDVFQNKPLIMDEQSSMALVQQYMQKAAESKNAKLKEEGAAFLEENKKKEGITTTASGLQYQVITEGQGKTPTANDNVSVNYTGKLLDGTVFDSSVESGQPATLGVGQVITGWKEALQLMQEGDKWIIFIPYDLAYGERGAGGRIPPFATLIFELELVKVN